MPADQNSLRPQSRPDRKGLWVRYIHPATGCPVRADLSTDVQEAETVFAAILPFETAVIEAEGGS